MAFDQLFRLEMSPNLTQSRVEASVSSLGSLFQSEIVPWNNGIILYCVLQEGL